MSDALQYSRYIQFICDESTKTLQGHLENIIGERKRARERAIKGFLTSSLDASQLALASSGQYTKQYGKSEEIEQY
ncbi:18669_t:CDS:2 [Funneliformis geosporum]|nr:18669_t:CDS:2 [Funneliformis geosporum]